MTFRGPNGIRLQGPHPARRGIPAPVTRHHRLLLLVVLTTAPALAEAVLLTSVGLTPTLGLAAQVTAPSPFGVFHDLRWVQVYHYSWWSFAWESAVAIVVRSLINAGIVSLAWPAEHEQRSWVSVLRRNLVFNLLVYVALSPWAAVAVAASDTSLFWFTLGEMVPLLFLSLVLQRGGIVDHWWRSMPSPREAGWALVAFAVLTADALVICSVAGWWRVPLVAVAGAVNAWLWRRLVVAAASARPRLRFVPAGPIALVISAAALLGMGQLSTIGGEIAQRPPPHVNRIGVGGVTQRLVYVAGYGSSLHPGSTPDTDLPVYRFSYSGIGPDGEPLPYGPADTHQSLATSARLLAQQVESEHRRTGRKVALIAQSEGTLVVHTFLAGYPRDAVDGAVDTAVLLSPLVQPAAVYFPPHDAGSGWGIATGWLLREMFAVVRATSDSHATPDEPFVRSVIDHAPFYRGTILCSTPGVRMGAFLPSAGALLVPPDTATEIPVIELPGIHASLLGDEDVQRRIIAFLRGQPLPTVPGGDYTVIQRAASAWRVPDLPFVLNPVWDAAGHPDPAFGENPCR